MTLVRILYTLSDSRVSSGETNHLLLKNYIPELEPEQLQENSMDDRSDSQPPKTRKDER